MFDEKYNEIIDFIEKTNFFDELSKIEEINDICVRMRLKKKYFKKRWHAYTGSSDYFHWLNEMHVLMFNPIEHETHDILKIAIDSYLYSKEAFYFSPFKLFEEILHVFCEFEVQHKCVLYKFMIKDSNIKFAIKFQYYKQENNKSILLIINDKEITYRDNNTYHLMLLIYKKIQNTVQSVKKQ